MGLLQVVVCNAASKLESHAHCDKETYESQNGGANKATEDVKHDSPILEADPSQLGKHASTESSTSDGNRAENIFLHLRQSDLRNLCNLLGREGY